MHEKHWYLCCRKNTPIMLTLQTRFLSFLKSTAGWPVQNVSLKSIGFLLAISSLGKSLHIHQPSWRVASLGKSLFEMRSSSGLNLVSRDNGRAGWKYVKIPYADALRSSHWVLVVCVRRLESPQIIGSVTIRRLPYLWVPPHVLANMLQFFRQPQASHASVAGSFCDHLEAVTLSPSEKPWTQKRWCHVTLLAKLMKDIANLVSRRFDTKSESLMSNNP